MTIITPLAARSQVEQCNALLLDVRGFEEFAAGHAEGATCIPLADLERRAGQLPTDRPVLVMCQSGGRSALACERLRALGMDNIHDVAGGFTAWLNSSLPAVRQASAIPLERQVRIAAGLLVLSFCIAGHFGDHVFYYGAAFIGMMLTGTGLLGICPMMSVLRLLPWNRITSSRQAS